MNTTTQQISKSFQADLMRAMDRTSGYDWYDLPILRDAERLGLVRRLSYTQIHWTDAGIAALDDDVRQAVRAELDDARRRKNARAAAFRNFAQMKLRAEADAYYAEQNARRTAEREALEARERRATENVEADGAAAYVSKMGREWWVDVEGDEIPSPFPTKREACAAVVNMLEAWRIHLAEPLRLITPSWSAAA